MSIIAIPSNDFSRYVVGITPTLTTRDAAPLFITWGIGVCVITAYILVHHLTTWASIGKRRAVHTNAYYSSKATTPMLFGFIAPN